MGMTHHEHGVHNVQAIANLALLRGMVGRPCAGLLPLRGHSNVQGIGSMGVTPRLKEAVLKRMRGALRASSCRRARGLDTMAWMDARRRAASMRLALCVGGNLYGSNPDANYAPTRHLAQSARSST